MMKNSFFEYGERFYTLANQYIDLIDNGLNQPRIDFLICTERLLSKLYSAACELPIVEGIDADDRLKKPTKNAEEFHRRQERIADLLGDTNWYWHIFDPIDKSDKNNPSHFSISYDMAEIYDDLVKSLELWKVDDSSQKEEAIFQWQMFWDIHWAYHAINAIKVIHRHVEEYFLDYDGDDFADVRNKNLE